VGGGDGARVDHRQRATVDVGVVAQDAGGGADSEYSVFAGREVVVGGDGCIVTAVMEMVTVASALTVVPSVAW